FQFHQHVAPVPGEPYHGRAIAVRFADALDAQGVDVAGRGADDFLRGNAVQMDVDVNAVHQLIAELLIGRAVDVAAQLQAETEPVHDAGGQGQHPVPVAGHAVRHFAPPVEVDLLGAGAHAGLLIAILQR